MKEPHHDKPAKAHELTPAEELHRALHTMVTMAETSGHRDNPEVSAAREVLQRHEKNSNP